MPSWVALPARLLINPARNHSSLLRLWSLVSFDLIQSLQSANKVLGADVSHPGVGSPQASMAAITMSWDQHACRYAAACETNGVRVELLSEANIKGMFVNLFKRWMVKVGGGSGPQHIYYFRDGVSEGQYQQVLDYEVDYMKKVLIEHISPAAAKIKWTVT